MYHRQRDHHRRELEREREQRLSYEKEQARRNKLKDSCPANKVRTYACNEDGYRLVKQFTYQYDFEQEKCTEDVRKKEVDCTAHQKSRESDDEDETISFKKYKEMKRRHQINNEEEDDDEERTHSKSFKVAKKHMKVQKESAQTEETE